jgi:hypothetical protein
MPHFESAPRVPRLGVDPLLALGRTETRAEFDPPRFSKKRRASIEARRPETSCRKGWLREPGISCERSNPNERDYWQR